MEILEIEYIHQGFKTNKIQAEEKKETFRSSGRIFRKKDRMKVNENFYCSIWCFMSEKDEALQKLYEHMKNSFKAKKANLEEKERILEKDFISSNAT